MPIPDLPDDLDPTHIDPPLIVNPSALPDQAGALIRIGLIALGSSLITHGWLPAGSDVNAIAGAVLSVIGAVWALYKATRSKAKLVVAAEAAPNRIAQVTRN